VSASFVREFRAPVGSKKGRDTCLLLEKRESPLSAAQLDRQRTLKLQQDSKAHTSERSFAFISSTCIACLVLFHLLFCCAEVAMSDGNDWQPVVIKKTMTSKPKNEMDLAAARAKGQVESVRKVQHTAPTNATKLDDNESDDFKHQTVTHEFKVR
jgi:hypothetical protein